MLNFDFKRSSRQCSKTNRPLQPGESFYSALIDNDGVTERMDCCVESWDSPPENCIGWWMSKVPELGKGKVYWAPRHVMLSYFEFVNGQPNEADTAYVTALLLLQKKYLTLEESPEEGGSQLLYLKNRKDNQTYQVSVVDLPPARLVEIQDELAERLFMDEPYDPGEDADGGEVVDE